MASNVFPMLSSSPPPMDDCPDEDDDDDEFGNFTSANIPFDSSFDSPVAVDKLKSFKSGENGVNDTNLSGDIHKFNCFSTSATPSPQDFVPNFSDEIECCKNVFKPIKTEIHKNLENDLCKSSSEDSECHDETEVTSHKTVPHKSEHCPDDSRQLSSQNCDIHKTSEIKNCHENNLEKEISKSPPSESKSFDEESLSPCDVSKGGFDSSHDLCIKNGTDIEFDQSKHLTSDTNADTQFEKCVTEVEKTSVTFNGEVNFACDFDFENEDEFDAFQQSENLFPSNDALCSTVKPDNESPVLSEVDSSKGEVEDKCENKQIEENYEDFSDNEFDDFQSCGGNISAQVAGSSTKSNDDEFDDFQDFQHTSVTKGETDDFADFQDFCAAETSETDDFADFSAVPYDSKKTSDIAESSDFADFEEAGPSASAECSIQASSVPQKSTDTLSTVLNAIFPITDSGFDCDTSDETSPQILEQSNKSRRLWEKLHEVEQTPSLRLQWGVSHSFQQLLRSVNVDYHSILRTSSVPIFASGLSLLEPVKGLSSSANHESEDRNHIPKIHIPPVEFDWNSSGLVNPLDCGQATSTLMDLSFLSSVDTESIGTSNDHSFENELLKPSPALACSKNSNKTPILEQLLSKNISSLPNSKQAHRPSDLSGEAVRVLDQLPDLSFMQAKVLMFPISSKT